MANSRSPGQGIELGQEFLRTVVERDATGMARLFTPRSVFRAVVPNEARPFREKRGRTAAVAQIMAWFEDADVLEVLDSAVAPVADRVKISYRLRVHEPDGWKEVEQQAYGAPGPNGFTRMNLVCSGFRPIPAPRGDGRTISPDQRAKGDQR